MKNSLFLATFMALLCLTCDGRQTKKEALQHAVEKFNQKNIDLSHISYYPEDPVEIVTDTIISNKIHINIKNYSHPDDVILISKTTKKSITKFNYHRVFESEIQIFSGLAPLLNTHISAAQFRSDHPDLFWDDATLQHAVAPEEL